MPSQEHSTKKLPRYWIFIPVAIAVGFLLAACVVYGPETEQKSSADIFNSTNFQGGLVLGVPVVKAQKRTTTIEGTAFATDIAPLKFQRLLLLDDSGGIVSETTTLHNGGFKFMGSFLNGDYLIRIDSARYSGATTVKVEDYELSNITVMADQTDKAN